VPHNTCAYTIVNQQPPTFMRELCADGDVSPILVERTNSSTGIIKSLAEFIKTLDLLRPNS